MEEKGMRSILSSRFGRLVVVEFLGKKGTANMYKAICDCGMTCEVRRSNLLSNITKSCGCLQAETRAKSRKTHGLRKHPLYPVYRQMLQRCNNPNNGQFADYGGRGITVCDRWAQGVEYFFQDMGERPTPHHQLDRIDNSKGYAPDNCKWSTAQENSCNRRNTVRLEVLGKSQTLREISESFGISYAIVRHAYYRHGTSALQALLRT